MIHRSLHRNTALRVSGKPTARELSVWAKNEDYFVTVIGGVGYHGWVGRRKRPRMFVWNK